MRHRFQVGRIFHRYLRLRRPRTRQERPCRTERIKSTSMASRSGVLTLRAESDCDGTMLSDAAKHAIHDALPCYRDRIRQLGMSGSPKWVTPELRGQIPSPRGSRLGCRPPVSKQRMPLRGAFPYEFSRHGEIFPSDGGANPAADVPAHRLDEFPAGYSLAGWSPPVVYPDDSSGQRGKEQPGRQATRVLW